jgi:hypothetical protein
MASTMKTISKQDIDNSVQELADYFVDIINDNNDDKPAQLSKLFEDYKNYLKAETSDALRGPRDEDDDEKLPAKLRAMVDALLVHAPIVIAGRHGEPDITLNRRQTGHFLLHTPHGRRLAEHLNNLSKGETPMPTIDIMKLSNIDSVYEVCKNISSGTVELSEFDFTKMVSGHAQLSKQPFEKLFNDQRFKRRIAQSGKLVASHNHNAPSKSYAALVLLMIKYSQA